MTIETQTTRRTLLGGFLNIWGSMPALASKARVLFVSQSHGNDFNSGTSPEKAVASLAQATTIIRPGDVLLLQRGDTWDEMLTINIDGATIGAFGAGPRPCISGSRVRHGILVHGRNVIVSDIEVQFALNAIYANGRRSSVSVYKSVLRDSGSGIVAGYGGCLSEITDVECRSCVLSLGAGDGVQISEDAADSHVSISRLNAHENEKSGINIKIGSASIAESTFSRNGECGILAQISAKNVVLKKSSIIGNNTADNGTFNVALEDRAELISVANLYANPSTGKNTCNNVNLSGQSRLTSVCDEFIENVASANIGATIRVNAQNNQSSLNLIHGSILKKSGGWVLDAYGCSNITSVNFSNCIADGKLSGGIRAPGENMRLRVQSSIINVIPQRVVVVTGEGIPEVAMSRPEGLLPVNPSEDCFEVQSLKSMSLKLSEMSSGRGAGEKIPHIDYDRDGIKYGEKPNLGARA